MTAINNIHDPIPTFTAAGTATRQIGASTLPLTTGIQTGSQGSFKNGTLQCQGYVPWDGIVTIEVDGACTVTLWLFSKATLTWINPGAAATAYQKTFSAAGMDYFTAKPGELFQITQGATTVHGYTNAPQYPASPATPQA
jgi:hypothetical protein